MLEAKGSAVREERSSRRAPLTEGEAERLLASVERVIVARGKRRREIRGSEATPADLRGPTGGFRAPILRIGSTLVVGFDPQSLDELL